MNNEFHDRDTQILGGSTDREFVHHAWRTHHEDLKNLPFPMLADIKRELTAALGILDEKPAWRSARPIIVDPENIIRFVYVTDLSVGRNPQEVLRVLDALQTDELCPCNWQKGQETLTSNDGTVGTRTDLCRPGGRATPLGELQFRGNNKLFNVRRMLSGRNYDPKKAERFMKLEELIENIPSYSKDLKLNFSSVMRQQTDLTEQQAWGTLVASAIASRSQELSASVLEEGATHLSAAAFEAAKGAAAVMGMNNIFYRFQHLVSNDKYRAMRAGLRMNVIRTHGIDPLDFELWSLAVSAINGCGACVDSHEKTLREKGISEEQILAAVRIASVTHALAVVLDAEKVVAAQPIVA